MRRSEAAKLVAMLSAAYRDAAISDATSELYETMLADLEFAVTQQAVARLICTSKWLPTVAEIRATAADIQLGPVRSGGEAWGDVLAEIRRTGYIGVPRFNDPLVARCSDIMTWRGLCLGDNEAADRARFIELYDNLAARERHDIVAGRALPEPARGLALPSPVGLLLAAPRERGDVLSASELFRGASEVVKATKAEAARPARRWTAEELDEELRRMS